MNKEFLSLEVLNQYTQVIKAFKNRYDVQNGTALGYRDNQDPNGVLRMENKPHSIGEGLTTTGFCVSASQAFLRDHAFQALLDYRGALAKLVSIDIKEEFWGACYNNSKNTWHTAILVQDNGIKFIIDMTCAQFGNRYVEKFIWAFDTWQKTFRSPICKHVIEDFDGNVLTYNLTRPEKTYNPEKGKNLIGAKEELRQRINKEVCLIPEEVDFLTEFFYENIEDFNTKLMTGVMSKYDKQYNNILNRCIRKMTVSTFEDPYYYVLTFPNKENLIKYLTVFDQSGFVVNHHILAKNDLSKICEEKGIKNLNSQDMKDSNEHYLVFMFEKPIIAVDLTKIIDNTIWIPYGTELDIENPEENIFNGKKLLDPSILDTTKTNTVYIKI